MSDVIDRGRDADPRDAQVNPLANPVTNQYALYLQPAYAGMKGDSMNDNVETFACGATGFGFGLVVGRTAPAALTVQAGGATPVGISLHDHTIASRGGYTQYDAVSIMNQGKVWCQVGTDTANIVDGAYVAYETATGKVVFTPTGNTVLPKAVFRSAPIAVYDINYATTTNIALVQLSYGLAVG